MNTCRGIESNAEKLSQMQRSRVRCRGIESAKGEGRGRTKRSRGGWCVCSCECTDGWVSGGGGGAAVVKVVFGGGRGEAYHTDVLIIIPRCTWMDDMAKSIGGATRSTPRLLAVGGVGRIWRLATDVVG